MTTNNRVIKRNLKKEFVIFEHIPSRTLFKVDLEDEEEVMKAHSWYPDNNGYIKGYLGEDDNGKSELVYLQRFIMGQPPEEGMKINFKDNDIHNCMKSNLEWTSHRNATVKNKGSLGVKKRGESSYYAYIVPGEYEYIGTFDNKVKAMVSYDKKAIEYFGKTANNNLKLGNYDLENLKELGYESIEEVNIEELKKNTTSKTGYVGIEQPYNVYRPYVYVKGNKIRLGSYEKVEKAVEVRNEYIDNHPECKSKKNELKE